jgi:hypothetical protein
MGVLSGALRLFPFLHCRPVPSRKMRKCAVERVELLLQYPKDSDEISLTIAPACDKKIPGEWESRMLFGIVSEERGVLPGRDGLRQT